MTIIKRESISLGKGKFAFPGKAKIIEVDISQEQSLVGEYPSRLVRIKFEVILFAHESPFDEDVVVEEEKLMMTQNVHIPWLQKVPYRLGQEYDYSWVDAFGMNGRHFIHSLLDEVEDFANFPPIESREMLWIKNEFLSRAIPSIPAHWELKGNSILIPKTEYYDIILEDKGVLPKQWFLYEAIANHQSYSEKYVDIINLEEGFCEAVNISEEAHASGGSFPVFSEYWKKQAKTHDGNGNY